MEAIKKTSLSQGVYQQLLNLIKKGELKPGDKLPTESELCETMGVSRTALREGIKLLASINVLTIFQGKGTFVNENPDIFVKDDALDLTLGKEAFDQIYEVRSLLDVGVAKCAAIMATDNDIKMLEETIYKMEKSLQCDPLDFDLAIEANESFHFLLCKATHNRILERVAWPIINHTLLRRTRKIGFTNEMIREAINGHRKIFEAINRKDAKAAAEEMEEHIKRGFNRLYIAKEKIHI